MTAPRLVVRFAPALDAVDAAAWDACANGANGPAERQNPFVSHAFLNALERSGGVGAETGWTPAHPLVEDDSGRLVAAAPAYLKTHSLGEYVFEQQWARAWARAGGRYYPKILLAVPFTPVTGARLLVAPHAPADARAALIASLRELREVSGASSIHATFANSADMVAFRAAGFLERTGKQFHFDNEGYRDFEDFLNALTSRKRKTIRRERIEALGDDLSVELLTGDAIEPRHWEAFFAFYLDTGSRKWGQSYLTRAFFHEIGRTMPERILLVMAKHGVDYVAGGINFLGQDAIYGRNWGALIDRPFLHFEICYYQVIDYAIAHGFKRVEAGAQGEHKLARGYRPVATQSPHEFGDARLQEAVGEYLIRERAGIAEMIEKYKAQLPFKRA